jgi:6-pyruvoyl-tetrahydropterin synthase related domain
VTGTAITNLKPEDLPAWMKPRRRTIDWGLLIVLILSLLIAWPLLARRALAPDSNAELIMFRSVEVARIIRSGALFSRWAPDFNYGLGSPLFNYLAPLPHYLSGYHQAFTDTGPVDSINLCMAASVVAAGCGMFLFVRQRWGTPASIVSAFVYLFSPPIALILPFFSGDLSLLMALATLPWALWAIDHLWLQPKRRTLVLATAALSAFILCDTRMAFLGAFLVIVVFATLRRFRENGSYEIVMVAIFAAAALTSFFWVPALVERDEIHWLANRSDPSSGPIFPGELLTDIPRFTPISPGAPSPVYRGLGIGTWLLALAGAAAVIWKARYRIFVFDAMLFLLVALILIALSTPTFQALWPSPLDFQPLLPYHAVLVAVFCLAVVSAQAVRWLEVLPAHRYALGLSVLCLIAPLASLAAVYPPETTAQQGATDFVAVLQAELQGDHQGTFRDGVLLPAAVPGLPDAPPNLLDSVRTDSFDRINRKAYSADAQVNLVEHSPFYDRYFFDVLRPGDVEFNILYYPGWNISIDGKRVETQPSPQGLLAVTLPKYSGEMAVWLEGTPIRYLSWAMTAGGAGLLSLVMRRLYLASRQPLR